MGDHGAQRVPMASISVVDRRDFIRDVLTGPLVLGGLGQGESLFVARYDDGVLEVRRYVPQVRLLGNDSLGPGIGKDLVELQRPVVHLRQHGDRTDMKQGQKNGNKIRRVAKEHGNKELFTDAPGVQLFRGSPNS